MTEGPLNGKVLARKSILIGGEQQFFAKAALDETKIMERLVRPHMVSVAFTQPQPVKGRTLLIDLFITTVGEMNLAEYFQSKEDETTSSGASWEACAKMLDICGRNVPRWSRYMLRALDFHTFETGSI